MNLKFFQLFMVHSIWGLGGGCHSLHHFNRMINSSSRGKYSGKSSGITSGNSSNTYFMHLAEVTNLVASLGSYSSNTRMTHIMPKPPTHSLSQAFPTIKTSKVARHIGLVQCGHPAQAGKGEHSPRCFEPEAPT